jgi:hypothetical protein
MISHPGFRFAPAAPFNKNNRINRLILARILDVYQCCAEVEPHAWTDCRSQLRPAADPLFLVLTLDVDQIPIAPKKHSHV